MIIEGCILLFMVMKEQIQLLRIAFHWTDHCKMMFYNPS